MRINVRKKLYLGFSIVLLLLLVVAGGNMNIQKMIVSASNTNTQVIGTSALAENLKYLIMTSDDTGAYYLLSNTQQDAETYFKKANEEVAAVKNAFNNLKQLTGDSEGVALLEAASNEYSKYVSDNNQAYQTFQASIKVGPDGKTLVQDEAGVVKAQQIYFAATLEPTLNSITKYSEWLKIKVSNNQQQVSNLETNSNAINIILTLVTLIFSGLIAFFLSSRMAKSLHQLQEAAAKIAEGNLTEEVTVKSKDEFGELAQGFNKMTKDLRVLIMEVIDTASTLGATSEELSAAAEQATSSSEQVSNTLGQLASGAADQAISVGNTGSVIEQLSANAHQVAVNAESVSQSSGKAAQAAELGAFHAENAVQKIEQIRDVSVQTAEAVFELGDQSKQIGQIVNVIKGIADQTNLLALNAAIEAARAGEQGRGFAVVAEEVRKLAEQSSMSATQIATLIGNIQRVTERAVEVMEKGKGDMVAGVEAVTLAGDSFRTIVVEVNTVVEQIQQVTVATQQMARGTSQAVQSVEDIGVIAEQTAASTQEVSAASEEQAATMASVSQSAEALAQLGERLSRLVSKFKV
ncbi:Methyl-accepting chemotaxis protein [Candidatus Desulfosporosinus infrequens]|uniref:Methyl-accepting chemotaxis protein n=1 Tax=Candidatus Desulfosporosinus infrequens TaxID=2043169 RepID=A0A2U3LUA6_9FIRM|nr:Methyl-accepting chemotaxis protein [Candidatus Desulfosporosinus infrequens]